MISMSACGCGGNPVVGDRVVVPNPERTPTDALGIMVVGEREMVLGIKPTMVLSARGFERPAFDHFSSPVAARRRFGLRPRSRFRRRLKAETEAPSPSVLS